MLHLLPRLNVITTPKVIAVDDQNRVKLSRRAVLAESGGGDDAAADAADDGIGGSDGGDDGQE